MNELLEKVENYWDGRSESFSEGNLEELNSFKRDAWIALIKEHAPKVTGRKLKVLDIGTGPGLFAIIMASLGYDVSAVDYTEAMLEKARNNAEMCKLSINFSRMDAQNLEFENDTFDLIVSRNLTWNLEKPDQAYKEWHRVLTPGGTLLNFDANWYLYLYDEQKRKEREQDRLNVSERDFENHRTFKNYKIMEDIAKDLPLSKLHRPEWDVQALINVGFKEILMDMGIGDRIWDERENLYYASTPMFMIKAVK